MHYNQYQIIITKCSEVAKALVAARLIAVTVEKNALVAVVAVFAVEFVRKLI